MAKITDSLMDAHVSLYPVDAAGIGQADRLSAQGGTLKVRSEPGHGATVTGRVPVGALEPVA